MTIPFGESAMIHCRMADEALIRRARLKSLKLTPSELSNRLGKRPSYYSELLNDDGRKSFGEKAARAIEQGLELPPLWLDQPGDEDSSPQPPTTAPRQAEIRQALTLIRNQLVHGSGETSALLGEALRLLAITPDSDRAFNTALAALLALDATHRTLHDPGATLAHPGRADWRELAASMVLHLEDPIRRAAVDDFLKRVDRAAAAHLDQAVTAPTPTTGKTHSR